jgi:hypothetical protein
VLFFNLCSIGHETETKTTNQILHWLIAAKLVGYTYLLKIIELHYIIRSNILEIDDSNAIGNEVPPNMGFGQRSLKFNITKGFAVL